MKKVLILFASETGNTARIAEMIAGQFGKEIAHVRPISEVSIEELTSTPYLIFGSPTWGSGEYHDRYLVFFNKMQGKLDFTGKKIALFGLGDQKYYGDTFVNGLGELYDKLVPTGADIIGQVPVESYDFTHSEAVRNGFFVGLPIDEDNQPELTPERIRKWVNSLKKLFGIS